MNHSLLPLLSVVMAAHGALSLAALGLAAGAVVGMATTFGQKSGSGYLGSLPVGTNSQPFLPDNCPDGVVDQILMSVSVQILATAGAGPLVVGGLAMGQDDLDLMGAACFSQFSARLDTKSFMFQGINWSQLRKSIQAATRFDIDSNNFVNGGVVGVGFATYRFQVPIPLSLPTRFVDGAMLGQGAARVRGGEIDVNVTALNGAGLALTNYTVSFQNVAVAFSAQGHEGDNSQVGMSWQVEFANWTQNKLTRPSATRVFFAITIPTATAIASWGDDTSMTLAGQENFDLSGPSETQQRYRRLILQNGGYDLTDGLTVIMAVDPSSTVSTLPAESGLTLKVPNAIATGLPYMDMQLIDAPASVTSTAAAGAAGSATASVTAAAPSIPSVQPGAPITAATQGRMPVVFRPAAPGAAGAAPPSQQAAARVTRRTLLGNAAGAKR